jgi:hypothetical protein
MRELAREAAHFGTEVQLDIACFGGCRGESRLRHQSAGEHVVLGQ